MASYEHREINGIVNTVCIHRSRYDRALNAIFKLMVAFVIQRTYFPEGAQLIAVDVGWQFLHITLISQQAFSHLFVSQ